MLVGPEGGAHIDSMAGIKTIAGAVAVISFIYVVEIKTITDAVVIITTIAEVVAAITKVWSSLIAMIAPIISCY